MKRRHVPLTVAALLSFAVAASLSPAGCRAGRGIPSRETDGRLTLRSGGVSRTSLYHLPPAYDGSEAVPLVFAYHGHGGGGADQRSLSGMNEVSDSGGFIVAYPDGIDRGWNDGRGINEGVDDVGFSRDLVEALESEFRIDPDRIFATGISNGGFMCFRLACEAPDVFAAVAPVAALMSVPLERSNASTTPVSILMINGTDDPLVPFTGGTIGGSTGGRGEGLSVRASIDYWVRLDGCGDTPVVTDLPDADPGDGTTSTRSVYAGGRDSTEVWLCAVSGGGHTWPGGPRYMRERIIGRVCRDFDASSYIWEFFRTHPRP